MKTFINLVSAISWLLLDKPGYGADLRCRLRQIEEGLIEITPTPPLRRVITFYDRMAGHMKMGGRMLAWRLVATADVPTRTIDSQMYPPTIRSQAFLATTRARRHGLDEAKMVA
jgi:hypothetical protein